ncbi:DNA ligase 1-like [Gouania willdenowi]|uniref:DNA ligase 1-like n=1 Tax=Gouania willdenowi TaxID=441366 RepID=UPI001054C48E|nr:DNA ligase 1-like [Gouania willdenowi]
MEELEQKNKAEIEHLQRENENFEETNANLKKVHHEMAQQNIMEEDLPKKEQELENQLKLKVELEQKHKAEIELLQRENKEYQEANAYLKNVEHQLDQQKMMEEEMLKKEQEQEKQLKLQVEQEQKYKAEIGRLQRESEDYQKNIEMYNQIKKEGEQHNEEIQKENEKYQKENCDLKDKLYLKKKEFSKFNGMDRVEQQLKAEIQRLEGENKRHCSEINDLKKQLDRLNNENWINLSKKRKH